MQVRIESQGLTVVLGHTEEILQWNLERNPFLDFKKLGVANHNMGMQITFLILCKSVNLSEHQIPHL